MATLYLCPLSLIMQWFTNIGLVANGGQVSTYVAGTVSTPVTTYTDSTGIVENPNPMTLSAAGRPQSTSGAPVAFWVPQGTVVKFVALDSSGNQLGVLDNVQALDDPTGILAQLATTTSGSGADLVANAVRSYDVFSSVRAANVPTITGSQTVCIDVEGANSAGDGLGGFFYWSPSSTAADDGVLVLKPNSLLTGQAGRYLRQPQTGYQGTVQMTLGGLSPSVVVTVGFKVINGMCFLTIPQSAGSSSGDLFGFSIPASSGLSPAQPQWFGVAAMQDNGTALYAQVGNIQPASFISGLINGNFYKNGTSTGWTGTGTKGVGDGDAGQTQVTIAYPLT